MRNSKGFLSDLDGVLYIEGSVDSWRRHNHRFSTAKAVRLSISHHNND